VSKIFISYRRADSATACGRIYDRLAARFGKEAVFKDVDSIPLGANFKSYIDGVMAQCAVELVVIGPKWQEIASEQGQRRLDDPSDVVRLEIEAALKRGLLVVPVLVQNAMMPAPERLPPSLQELAYRNGMPVRDDPDFEGDIRRLIAALERFMPAPAATYAPVPAANPVYAANAPMMAYPQGYAVAAMPSAPPLPPVTGHPVLRWGGICAAIAAVAIVLYGIVYATAHAISQPFDVTAVIVTLAMPFLASLLTTRQTGRQNLGVRAAMLASITDGVVLIACFIILSKYFPVSTGTVLSTSAQYNAQFLVALLTAILIPGYFGISSLLGVLGGSIGMRIYKRAAK
jgi:uncharacterized protein YqgC (DUF456 family)